MTLLKRQVETVAEKALLQFLQEGRIPSPSALKRAADRFLKRAEGGPLMQIRPQGRKARWDLASQNLVFEELDADLTVLFEEMVEIGRTLLRRHNLTEIAYLSQSGELDRLNGELDNLLFVVANTDERFFGIFDNFKDFSKLDMDLTTSGAIDLSESAAVLPSGALSTRKVPLTHLYDIGSWVIGVNTTSQLISNQVGSDAPFGNAFHDVISVWRQDVVVAEQGPVTIEFTIPVSAIETQEVSITRVQVVPHSVHEMDMKISKSTDNVNYVALPGSTRTLRQSGREYNIDFARTRVQFLRFQLTKDTADEHLPGVGYRYSFGLQHVGLYTVGRLSSAEVVSRILTPPGMEVPISKVSLRSFQSIPDKCNIRWWVKGIDNLGRDVGDWRPIAPVGIPRNQVGEVVTFGNEVEERFLLTGTDASLYDTYKNHQLYSLDTNVLPTGETEIDLVPNSGTLLRGINAWSRNRRQEKIVRRVRDSFITFKKKGRQKLWTIVTDSARVSTSLSPVTNSQVTFLQVNGTIDYEPETYDLIADPDVDPQQDPTPEYAISKITQLSSVQSVTGESITVGGGKPGYFAYANVDLEGDLTVTYSGETLELNKDYYVGVADDGRTWIGRQNFDIFVPGLRYETQTWSVSYTLDPDVTQLVETVKGNTVIMKQDLLNQDDTRFEVSYRFVPVGSYRIMKNTVRVTERRGTDEGALYKEGQDYSVDTRKGIMTNLPGGGISVAYVDFYYEAPASQLETYTIWAFVDTRDPKPFLFDALDLNTEEGESFVVRHGADVVKLTEQTRSPDLVFGWHQFVVRSLDPDAYVDNAIDTVANLRDRAGDPVFASGGKYFSRLLATRQPLTQVDPTYLLTNVLPAKHENFGLLTDGTVLVNFEPGTVDDLYTNQPRLDENGAWQFQVWPEEFELTYRRRFSTTVDVSSLRVKAELTRDDDADAGLTPKVNGYQMRVA